MRQKAMKSAIAEKDQNLLTYTYNISTRSQKEKETFTVKLPLPTKSCAPYKKYQRALRAVNRKIIFMKEKCQKLQKEK